MVELSGIVQLQFSRLVNWLRRLLGNDRGATVAEYALVLVLVAVALIGVLTTLGDALRNRIQDVIDKLPTP
ncbi:MAG: Flp family type IVb pilin [Bacillota bacterium]